MERFCIKLKVLCRFLLFFFFFFLADNKDHFIAATRSFRKIRPLSLSVSTMRVYDVDIGSCYETAVVFRSKKFCSCFWTTRFRIRTFYLTNCVPSTEKTFHFALYHSLSLSLPFMIRYVLTISTIKLMAENLSLILVSIFKILS